MSTDEQIAFFERTHYLLLPSVVNEKELAVLHAAIDRHREEFPALWSQGRRMQAPQCLLNMPEADFLIRHPSFMDIATHALDGDIVFDEFSIMIRAGGIDEGSQEGWHRDFTPDPQHRLGIRGLSVIYYLTDVDETTARYVLVPASHQRDDEPAKTGPGSDTREGELEVFAPAGSMLLVNAGNWHCGRCGHGGRERRTVHIYYRKSTTAPFANHTIFPRRLWDVPDPEQRRFYSSFNPITQAVAADYTS